MREMNYVMIGQVCLAEPLQNCIRSKCVLTVNFCTHSIQSACHIQKYGGGPKDSKQECRTTSVLLFWSLYQIGENE